MLSWGYTVHKMQETTVCTTLVNLGSKLFAPGQYGVSPKIKFDFHVGSARSY
jgi:hypothetical protein